MHTDQAVFTSENSPNFDVRAQQVMEGSIIMDYGLLFKIEAMD